MNQRILDIAKTAGLKFTSETALSPVEIKFAEQIVRECAEVARLNTRVDSKVYLMIQEHFGIE